MEEKLMAFVGACGHVRDPDFSKPCLRCQQAEKEAEKEREWEKNHPDKEKYLREAGWQKAKLEKGFPGLRSYLGWWHEKFSLAQQRYFTLEQALRIQRYADDNIEPKIISGEDGFVVI